MKTSIIPGAVSALFAAGGILFSFATAAQAQRTTLDMALDSTGIEWSTTGYMTEIYDMDFNLRTGAGPEYGWSGLFAAESHDGQDMALSYPMDTLGLGAGSYGSSCTLTAKVNGPGMFSAWCKGDGYFLLDGRDISVPVRKGAGNNVWFRVEIPVRKGVHTIETGLRIPANNPAIFPPPQYEISGAMDEATFASKTVAPFRTWAEFTALSFPSSTGAPDMGPGADPDRDGLANLLEYATGSDPLVPDPSPVTFAWQNGSVAASVTPNRAATDLTWIPEGSETAAAASWSNNFASLSGDGAGILTARLVAPADWKRGFLRFNVGIVPAGP